MISVDKSAVLQIINFLILIFVLNWLLFRPIRQILSQRKEKIGSLEQTAAASLRDAGEKDAAYASGVKAAVAAGLEEKNALLGAAADEEKELLGQISRKNQEHFADVKAKIDAEADAVRTSLLGDVDVFAEAISRKILGRAVS